MSSSSQPQQRMLCWHLLRSPWTSFAPFIVTAMRRIALSRTAATARWLWPVAGRTCAGSFTTPWKVHHGLRAAVATPLRHRGTPAGWQGRARVAAGRRAHQSRPTVRRLERVLLRLKAGGRQIPQSPLGQTLDYALGQWHTLTVEIDNNLVENAIRPTASRTRSSSGKRKPRNAAPSSTIIESCKRRWIEPYAYLMDVLTRLPHLINHQVKDITPRRRRRQKQTVPPQSCFINVVAPLLRLF